MEKIDTPPAGTHGQKKGVRLRKLMFGIGILNNINFRNLTPFSPKA
jgi:hypothetical protein